MAGSNQAQPLNGLLGSLTGAFNQEDMGQGLMFAQNIRDYNAPVLDANDPNSVLDRQRWAQMNGYQNEALALGSRLGDLNLRKQQQDDRAEYNRMRSALSQLETQRQKALSSLTVPGGGPVSPQQIAEVNARFDAARDKLAFRIDEFAGKVEGASGTDGTDAVNSNKMARRIESVLINNGLGDYREMAPYLDPSEVQELLKNKNKLNGKTKTGTIKRYANGAINTAYDDGTASILTPGGKIILSDEDPVAYEAELKEGIAAGPELDALTYGNKMRIEESAKARTDLREGYRAAVDNYSDFKFVEESAEKFLADLESGNLTTNPVKGWAARFGFADEQTGELQAAAVYQTLQNLQITRLAPVSNEEMRLVAQMFVDPSSMTSANLGRAKFALKQIRRAIGNLDIRMQDLISEARATGNDEDADRYEEKWNSFRDRLGGEGTENLTPDPDEDRDIDAEADALINSYSTRQRGPQ
ncbi:MAG: hypothetical protein EBT18_10630 [Gammaproteobacteria bacterium]|nr:hypothetical protein [Gammaproteobacteria bacterium]